ncbi:hypothetical protein LXL04_007146 [Taraxacum kok-saghyz]
MGGKEKGTRYVDEQQDFHWAQGLDPVHPTKPGSNPPRRDNNSILSNLVSHKGASLLWTRFEPGTIPPETPGRGKLEYASDQLNWTSLAINLSLSNCFCPYANTCKEDVSIRESLVGKSRPHHQECSCEPACSLGGGGRSSEHLKIIPPLHSTMFHVLGFVSLM